MPAGAERRSAARPDALLNRFPSGRCGYRDRAAGGRPAGREGKDTMSRYQLRTDDGEVITEESFDSFETANAWALQQDVEPGWTLYQQIGGEWTAARFDPS
jgi:hypothetical protein